LLVEDTLAKILASSAKFKIQEGEFRKTVLIKRLTMITIIREISVRLENSVLL